MRKINKTNKRGFTLVEMVLVIFVIITLAAVLGINVATYLSAAKGASEDMTSDVNNMTATNAERIDKFSDYGFGA